MKIDDKIMSYEIGSKISNIQSEKDVVNEIAKKKVAQEDTLNKDAIVDISQRSREIQKIREALDKIDIIREDKIVELKDKIEKGTYQIDHEKVAEKMIDEFLSELI